MLRELEKKNHKIKETIEVDEIKLREKDKELRVKELRLKELRKLVQA
jgi:hypothetical protein